MISLALVSFRLGALERSRPLSGRPSSEERETRATLPPARRSFFFLFFFPAFERWRIPLMRSRACLWARCAREETRERRR